MVNVRVTDRQKGADSPKTEVGEIDTRAPFQSVKAAVSLFGEVALSRQRSTPRRSRLSAENVLDKETQLMLAQKEFTNLKQKLQNAMSTRARALSDLTKANTTLTDLTNKLDMVNKSKLSALQLKQAVQRREEQLQHDKSHGPPHHQELDIAREQYLSSTLELDAAKQRLYQIRQDFSSASESKIAALQQEAVAQRAFEANFGKVAELSKEISDMKDAIQQLKLAAAQNHQEYTKIMKEKDDLQQSYRVAVEDAETKLLVLRQDYDPDLSRTLEAKLAETSLEIEVLREEMKRAHESEMNAVKVITNDLNDATMRLQEAADEECSLRSMLNTLRMELEDVQREHKLLKEKEAEKLAIKEQKKSEALEEENLKLEKMSLEAAGARQEAEKMNGKIEILRKEAEAARVNVKEADKRLELVTREVEEAKAAEERVRNEMKVMSQKQGSKKQEVSDSKIKITLQEFESLKKGRESEKIETRLAAVTAQLDEINARKVEADEKLEATLKAIEEIKTAMDLAEKSAESAEAAKGVVEAELRRWRQQENPPHA